MKLIFIDPGCSGLQVVECGTGSIRGIEKALSKYGIDKESSADCIYYCVVSEDGKITEGRVDFT